MHVRRGVLVAAAVALIATGCTTTADPPEPPASAGTNSSAAPAEASAQQGMTEVELSPSIDHVHGLVAMDADTVVAGTHTGARLVNGNGVVSAPGDARDDLMGMTGEAGTTRLASSGHPGAGSPLPNPVGLIVSEDGGETWTPVTLQGQVDFHALAVSGTHVTGYGGGERLLLSTDGGRTWQEGARLQPAALAHSGGRILATTAAGVQVSVDGGRTFRAVEDAPTLVLISAGADQTVLGLDTASRVWTSRDRGRTWDKAGRAPGAQAVAALRDGSGHAISQTTLFTVG